MDRDCRIPSRSVLGHSGPRTRANCPLFDLQGAGRVTMKCLAVIPHFRFSRTSALLAYAAGFVMCCIGMKVEPTLHLPPHMVVIHPCGFQVGSIRSGARNWIKPT